MPHSQAETRYRPRRGDSGRVRRSGRRRQKNRRRRFEALASAGSSFTLMEIGLGEVLVLVLRDVAWTFGVADPDETPQRVLLGKDAAPLDSRTGGYQAGLDWSREILDI